MGIPEAMGANSFVVYFKEAYYRGDTISQIQPSLGANSNSFVVIPDVSTVK
jgi:hypothetical protein